MYAVKKCGIKLKPLSLLVTYIELSSNKLRCRQMPLRNFKESSNVSMFAADLKKNQRHRSLLNNISQLQIEKLLLIIQGHMKGYSLDEAMKMAESELTIDPNQDLCKEGEEEIEKAKRIMDETFNENRVKADNPNFEYDVEVEFDQPVESSGWDSDDPEEF